MTTMTRRGDVDLGVARETEGRGDGIGRETGTGTETIEAKAGEGTGLGVTNSPGEKTDTNTGGMAMSKASDHARESGISVGGADRPMTGTREGGIEAQQVPRGLHSSAFLMKRAIFIHQRVFAGYAAPRHE